MNTGWPKRLRKLSCPLCDSEWIRRRPAHNALFVHFFCREKDCGFTFSAKVSVLEELGVIDTPARVSTLGSFERAEPTPHARVVAVGRST